MATPSASTIIRLLGGTDVMIEIAESLGDDIARFWGAQASPVWLLQLAARAGVASRLLLAGSLSCVEEAARCEESPAIVTEAIEFTRGVLRTGQPAQEDDSLVQRIESLTRDIELLLMSGKLDQSTALRQVKLISAAGQLLRVHAAASAAPMVASLSQAAMLKPDEDPEMRVGPLLALMVVREVPLEQFMAAVTGRFSNPVA